MDITLLLLVRATYMWCCSLCTFRSWWTAHSAQRQRTRCDNTNSALSGFAALCNKSICCDYVDLTVSDLPFPPTFAHVAMLTLHLWQNAPGPIFCEMDLSASLLWCYGRESNRCKNP